MNTILENKSKLDKLVQEGYKIIYPNSIDGLDFEIDVIEKYTFSSDEKFSPIMTAREYPGLNWYEKVFKYRDSLFLIPYHFQMDSAREYFLSFDKDTATKYFGLKYILITSDKKESSSINESYEKINYI